MIKIKINEKRRKWGLGPIPKNILIFKINKIYFLIDK